MHTTTGTGHSCARAAYCSREPATPGRTSPSKWPGPAIRRGWPVREVGQVPFRPDSFWGRNLFAPLLLGFVFRRLLTVNTPLGRRARPGVLAKGAPLIRVKRCDLAAAGVQRVARVVGARGGAPVLADGRVLSVANIIWCTGFHPAFDWIDLPVFGPHGEPQHRSGVVERQPGLYFVGLPFLHSMSSSMVHGVGRDAARVVATIRRRATRAAAGESAANQADF